MMGCACNCKSDFYSNAGRYENVIIKFHPIKTTLIVLNKDRKKVFDSVSELDK